MIMDQNKKEGTMKVIILLLSFLMVEFLPSVFFLKTSLSFAQETIQTPSETLVKLEGEILEVEELREPIGSAIYTVKDLSSGRTLRLFAHPYRTLIQIGSLPTAVGNVLGGSKATIIYKRTPKRDIPEIVFAKVAGSFYS